MGVGREYPQSQQRVTFYNDLFTSNQFYYENGYLTLIVKFNVFGSKDKYSVPYKITSPSGALLEQLFLDQNHLINYVA